MESRLSQRLSKYISFVSKYSLNGFLNFTCFNGLRIQDSRRAVYLLGEVKHRHTQDPSDFEHSSYPITSLIGAAPIKRRIKILRYFKEKICSVYWCMRL